MYTYVDLILALILVFYVIRGIRQGVFPLIARLVSLVLAIAAAFYGYQWAGQFILERYPLMTSLAYGAGFLAIFVVAKLVFHFVLNRLFSLIPDWLYHSLPSRLLAVIPALIDGVISVALLLLLVMVVPMPPSIRSAVTESRTGGIILGGMQRAEEYSQHFFGNAIDQALTFITTEPESNESVAIPFHPKTLTVDEVAEAKMLELVNAERAKVGAKPLVVDPTLTDIARAHSRDMWEKSYFSHVNPDGMDPFDRMEAGGAVFLSAGENLAYSPTVSIAHRGLMNSPGHKRNILDPDFGRVGIGVIDGGAYGQMFTQDFAN